MESVNYVDVVNPDDVFATLPDGDQFLTRRPYTPGESRGVMVRRGHSRPPWASQLLTFKSSLRYFPSYHASPPLQLEDCFLQ